MKTSGTQLSVWSGDSSACIKVAGRANFSASTDFKKAINWLCERGYPRITLDLSDCLLMDSTFVGVLAGLGRRLESSANHASRHAIEILNPNERVTDLLDNLGVTSLFQVVQGSSPDPKEMTEVTLPSTPPGSRQEIAQTCLQAHQDLIQANPANAEKFKDVTHELSEEIKRYENE